MLSTLAGFEPPTAGSISIDDDDVTDVPAHRRRIGLTFQSYALFPHMTVAQNVGFPLRVRGVSKKPRRDQVARALDFVRLGGLGDRRPHELSGGQQQRVALARAFVFEPQILLLDEPLAALDRQLRQTVQVELSELQRELGITTVAVTHDQEEALTMSDRIVVLKEGRIQQHGAPDRVYMEPKNNFVASFLGTANLFQGPITNGGGRHTLHWKAQDCKLPICPSPPADHATAMLRPEQLRIVEPSEGTIRGRIRTAVYLGAFTRYRIEMGDAVIEVNETGPIRHRDGEAVGVTWDVNDVWIIPERNGSAQPSTPDSLLASGDLNN